MNIFNLTKTDHKDGTYGLHPNETTYSEEYAKQRCEHYLTNEVSNNKTYYELHTKLSHDDSQSLVYDVYCPKCGNLMRKITRNRDLHNLGYYECKKCNKGGK